MRCIGFIFAFFYGALAVQKAIFIVPFWVTMVRLCVMLCYFVISHSTFSSPCLLYVSTLLLGLVPATSMCKFITPFGRWVPLADRIIFQLDVPPETPNFLAENVVRSTN